MTPPEGAAAAAADDAATASEANAPAAAADDAAAASEMSTSAAGLGPTSGKGTLVTAALKACQACASCLEAMGAAAAVAKSRLTGWDAMPWRACKARWAHLGVSSCRMGKNVCDQPVETLRQPHGFTLVMRQVSSPGVRNTLS